MTLADNDLWTTLTFPIVKANDLKLGQRVVVFDCACSRRALHAERRGTVTSEALLTRSGRTLEGARVQIDTAYGETRKFGHYSGELAPCRITLAVLEDEYDARASAVRAMSDDAFNAAWDALSGSLKTRAHHLRACSAQGGKP